MNKLTNILFLSILILSSQCGSKSGEEVVMIKPEETGLAQVNTSVKKSEIAPVVVHVSESEEEEQQQSEKDQNQINDVAVVALTKDSNEEVTPLIPQVQNPIHEEVQKSIQDKVVQNSINQEAPQSSKSINASIKSNKTVSLLNGKVKSVSESDENENIGQTNVEVLENKTQVIQEKVVTDIPKKVGVNLYSSMKTPTNQPIEFSQKEMNKSAPLFKIEENEISESDFISVNGVFSAIFIALML